MKSKNLKNVIAGTIAASAAASIPAALGSCAVDDQESINSIGAVTNPSIEKSNDGADEVIEINDEAIELISVSKNVPWCKIVINFGSNFSHIVGDVSHINMSIATNQENMNEFIFEWSANSNNVQFSSKDKIDTDISFLEKGTYEITAKVKLQNSDEWLGEVTQSVTISNSMVSVNKEIHSIGENIIVNTDFSDYEERYGVLQYAWSIVDENENISFHSNDCDPNVVLKANKEGSYKLNLKVNRSSDGYMLKDKFIDIIVAN